jgi:hypothetical protein
MAMSGQCCGICSCWYLLCEVLDVLSFSELLPPDTLVDLFFVLADHTTQYRPHLATVSNLIGQSSGHSSARERFLFRAIPCGIGDGSDLLITGVLC